MNQISTEIILPTQVPGLDNVWMESTTTIPGSTTPTTRSTGPRTEDGKARSSANRAVNSHGLTGFALVLPGENVENYKANLSAWITAIGPGTTVEIQMVTQLADLAWRLDRCARLEHRRHLAEVEERVNNTPEAKTCWRLYHAGWIVNVIVDYADRLGEMTPEMVPTGAAQDLTAFIAGCAAAVPALRDAEVPDALVAPLEQASSDLEVAARAGKVERSHFAHLAEVSRGVAEYLSPLLAAAQEAVERAAAQVAEEVSPAGDKAQRKLTRYRTEIEKSQARLLDNLGKVREQVKAGRDVASDVSTAPPTLRVRVVN